MRRRCLFVVAVLVLVCGVTVVPADEGMLFLDLKLKSPPGPCPGPPDSGAPVVGWVKVKALPDFRVLVQVRLRDGLPDLTYALQVNQFDETTVEYLKPPEEDKQKFPNAFVSNSKGKGGTLVWADLLPGKSYINVAVQGPKDRPTSQGLKPRVLYKTDRVLIPLDDDD